MATKGFHDPGRNAHPGQSQSSRKRHSSSANIAQVFCSKSSEGEWPVGQIRLSTTEPHVAI